MAIRERVLNIVQPIVEQVILSLVQLSSVELENRPMWFRPFLKFNGAESYDSSYLPYNSWKPNSWKGAL